MLNALSLEQPAPETAGSAQTQSLIFLSKTVEILNKRRNTKYFENISQIHDILVLLEDT